MLCAECGKPATAYLKGEGKSKIYLCAACYEKHKEKHEGDLRRACVCGTTIESFQKTGLLGCPECYKKFREQIMPTVKTVQGRVLHVGKRPEYNPKDDSIEIEEKGLKALLEHAIRKKDYTEAEKLKEELAKLAELKKIKT